MPKLTLSADKDVIDDAKRIARQRGTSVSALFSQFIRSMAEPVNGKPERPGPLTRQAIGLVSLPDDKSDQQLIEQAVIERHGR